MCCPRGSQGSQTEKNDRAGSGEVHQSHPALLHSFFRRWGGAYLQPTCELYWTNWTTTCLFHISHTSSFIWKEGAKKKGMLWGSSIKGPYISSDCIYFKNILPSAITTLLTKLPPMLTPKQISINIVLRSLGWTKVVNKGFLSLDWYGLHNCHGLWLQQL